MQRVTLVARYPPDLAHPIHRRLADADGVTRVEFLAWGPTATVTTLAWYDGARAAVSDLLEAVETTETHLVDADDGTYAFVAQPSFAFPEPVMDRIRRARVAFLPPVTFLERGAVRFEAVGGTAALGAFRDDLADLAAVRVERVGPFRRRPAPTTLTDRQAAALDAALATGYYDVPRTGSVADVAADLDCATSTAGELLRKAEAAVVRAFVSDRPTGSSD